MRKILSFILLLFVTLFSSVFLIKAANDSDKLVIYYYRYDGNYNDFNIWLWQNEPEGKGGNAFNFSNSNVDSKYGAYVEIDLTKSFGDTVYGETTRFGIIIKEGGGWEGYREPGGDRFFNKDDMEVINGKYRVYVVEQDFNIGTSTADLDNGIPNYDPKILKADFNTSENFEIRLTEVATKIEVLKNGAVIDTQTPNNTSFTLNKTETINLLNTYQIKATFSNGTTHTRNVAVERLYDTTNFKNIFTYEGELGALYEANKTTFRLWAPISQSVKLNLYNQGHPNYDRNGNPNKEDNPYETYELTRIENGAWEVVVDGNLENKYYTFSVENYGLTQEVTDPYSFSTGANGVRSMVVNFDGLNPADWTYGNRPSNITNLTDYIIYELHVRDLTSHSSWEGNDDYRAKFMGFTEGGTTYTNREGITVTTGLDHLDELGVNAVHLLPIFDFGYVDEIDVFFNRNMHKAFNWGYMPYHFNTLEGSYSTNPFDGGVRVNEFKQLVQSLHSRDIRVIMDVVYNHTGESETSNFHKILPGYYHRIVDGGFSNGSGTGNETESRRPMVRKFIVDSVLFFAEEYNVSGFRFDLMALHDVDTMSAVEDALHEIDPTIIVYGEPWTGGGTPLPSNQQAGKGNLASSKLRTVGGFNDTTRDAIKGSPDGTDKGWIQGDLKADRVNGIKYGIAGGVNAYGNAGVWHGKPEKAINYISAHDNRTLNDKLLNSGLTNATDREKAQILGNAIILTSQGVPFLHAGVDFMRSKPLPSGGFDHNSYESPDEVNQLDWSRKARYNNVFEYYKNLIHLRKNNPQFKMINASDIKNYLSFVNTNDNGVIHFEINHPNYPTIVVVHNANKTKVYPINLPAGKVFNLHTTMVEANFMPITTISNAYIATGTTTTIMIEQKSGDNVSVKNAFVNLKKGDSFNPLSNLNYNPTTQKVYVNSFVDTNVSGRYIVGITVVDQNGVVIPLTYTVIVEGVGSDVNIRGGLGL